MKRRSPKVIRESVRIGLEGKDPFDQRGLVVQTCEMERGISVDIPKKSGNVRISDLSPQFLSFSFLLSFNLVRTSMSAVQML